MAPKYHLSANDNNNIVPLWLVCLLSLSCPIASHAKHTRTSTSGIRVELELLDSGTKPPQSPIAAGLKSFSPELLQARQLDERDQEEDHSNNATSHPTTNNGEETPAPAKEKESNQELEEAVHVLGSKEVEALQLLYKATKMRKSKQKHNWFDSKFERAGGTFEYCSFNGIVCKRLSTDREEEEEEDDDDDDGATGETTKRTSTVVKLHLKDRGMSSSIPEAVLEGLPHLTSLNLASNDLSGSLPQSLENLGELRDLDLSRNRLSGSFPSLNGTADVKKIMLQYNRLEGRLPSQGLCQFQGLKALDISGNEDMHGKLPNCMEDFEDLSLLKFDGVGLRGEIPSPLCRLDRKMNGLNPNNFGCNAIACPPGTFESTSGRQRDKSTPCEPCPYWEDNDPMAILLGSQMCPAAPTLPPTVSPSDGPTSSPSWQPSLSPSFDPTLLPTWATPLPSSAHPSRHPTEEKGDTQTPLVPTHKHTHDPSPITTVGESLWTNETLIVELALMNVRRPLETQSLEVSDMEDLATKFLEQHDQEETWLIAKLTLLNQRLAVGEKSLLSANHNQVSLVAVPPTRHLRSKTNSNTGEAILFLHPPLQKSRDLQSNNSVLFIEMAILLSFQSASSTFNQTKSRLIAAWNQNMDEFLGLLKDSQTLVTLFEDPVNSNVTVDNNVQSPIGGSGPSSTSQWTILRISLIMAFVAVLSVAVLAFTRFWYHHRNGGYRKQEDVVPQDTHSDSSITSSSPHKSQEKTTSNPEDEDDMLREALDARSAFSCWKHWDTVNGVVSEESDGGWNSGSGSGSVPDSYLHGDSAKSLGGNSSLLDPYTSGRDDVWSVAPDHPLCFSTSNNGSDEEEEGVRPCVRRIDSSDSIIVIATTSLQKQEDTDK